MEIAPLPITPLLQGQRFSPLQPLTEGAGPTFAGVLRSALAELNTLQRKADTAARGFAVGEVESVHDTVIAMEKADIAMRLVTNVRNKIVEAYQDIMRMPL